MRSTTALTTCLALVGLCALSSTVRAEPPALTAQDYVDIEQLYATYVRVTDMGGGGDGSDYAALFTPDGEFEQSGRINRGPDALKRMIAGFHAGLKKNGWSSRHTYAGLMITPTPEGARGSVYALIFNVTTRPPFVDHSGVYEDTLVKTADGWRFKKRIFKPSGAFEPGLPLGAF
ncbi:MAG: nuclear transport factor 2 family protein [Acidimicrobiia bacterium]|nr:nuclear transport factor 2 family protein [Acidimicrobiia bacterium]